MNISLDSLYIVSQRDSFISEPLEASVTARPSFTDEEKKSMLLSNITEKGMRMTIIVKVIIPITSICCSIFSIIIFGTNFKDL